jgi:Alb1
VNFNEIMAKTAPAKKKGICSLSLNFQRSLIQEQGQSIHSRAARRASSPSIDTDKSLKNVKPPPESLNHRPSILAIHQGSGVTKKTKHGRKAVLSAKAKRRQEKGLDRAETVMDRIEVKVQKSKGRARAVQERRRAWEELNRKLPLKEAEMKAEKDVLENESYWVDEGGEKGDELDHGVIDGVKGLQVAGINSLEGTILAANGILIEGEIL